MSTRSKKTLTALALAAVVAAGSLAVPSSADARTYHRYFRPFHHYYGYYGYYGRPAYGSYGRPVYRRGPIYNFHDAHKLDRELVGVGD